MPAYRTTSLLVLFLSAIQYVLSGGSSYHPPKDPNKADLPGHSDLYKVKGPSGYGCQVADWEVMPYRTPSRKGEDDGSLWTGETVVFLSKASSDRGSEPKTVCSGTFRLPTVFWIGPYLQGQNGTGNTVAMGMLGFETNSSAKSDAWQVYRPCNQPYDRSPGLSKSTFAFLAGAQFGHGSPSSINATLGFDMTRPVTSNSTTNGTLSTSIIHFNGALNDFKEQQEYFGGSRYGSDFFRFNSYETLNCTKLTEGYEAWKAPNDSLGYVRPGSVINGTIAADSIVLEMRATHTAKLQAGVENKDEDGNFKPTATRFGYELETLRVTFNGQFDSRNSSQKVVINTTSDTVVAFSSAPQWLASVSLLLVAAACIVSCIVL